MTVTGMTKAATRLTAMAHGGGCGCKLAPSVLTELLRGMPTHGAFPGLLVGPETADDAAVWRLNEHQALVATADFFTPIVDDPREFGRIAAANALSDVYAMGAAPIMALALVGMPLGRLPAETMRQILAGGAEICAEAGIPVAGGHSIDSPEPLYGLAAMGLVDPLKVLRNDTGRPGDALILGKGLGIGVYSAALRQGRLGEAPYRAMIASATRLNSVGAILAGHAGVHAMTDVTGFGLPGHLLEMCRGSGLAARVHLAALPFLPEVEALAEAGFLTGASRRNWDSYGAALHLPQALPEWRRLLLCDPQTSGGLLVAVAPDAAEAVLGRMHDDGYAEAALIGSLEEGRPEISFV